MPTDEFIFNPIVFPFLLAAMWIAVSAILGLLSGWFALQRKYPRPGDEPLLVLSKQSGQMGWGVALSGILKLSAHEDGLGIGISRIFGPFQRSFIVPWNEIEAEPGSTVFAPNMKLMLGRPPAGSLKISARSWSKLIEAAGSSNAWLDSAHTSPSDASIAKGMFLEWLVFTALAASFFYFAPRLSGNAPEIPIAICIGFPAVVIGIGQLMRYSREK